MANLFSLAGPLLRLTDPEWAHRAAIRALAYGPGLVQRRADPPPLGQDLWGLHFPNPVGIAAGFDKDAEAVGPLFGLGLGFVEVGSITPKPQPGNPRPRVFRLAEDGAVINRYGFNSLGIEAAEKQLARWRGHLLPGPLGVNLGKNKESEDAAADYRLGAERLGPYADYLVINVSSPNTPGLRALQSRESLAGLIAAVQDSLAKLEKQPPLLLKIAPDLTEADKNDIAAVALESGLSGLIVSNTTVARPESLRSRHKAEAGGLSGKPLFAPSTALLAEFYRLTEGKLPLVGVGGISSAEEAYAKIRAGASLVQLYTALVYQGPGLIGRIKQGLLEALRRDGFAGIAEAVGADHGKKA
jgi:dihydroorotate dehydrogenase